MNKLSIVFAMHYEVGHILCTFKLAKKLQSIGHEIVYLTIPDRKDLIENQGFKVALFAEDLMPLGFTDINFSHSKSRRRHQELIFSSYVKKITDGTLDACIKSVGADICICDPFLSYVAVRSLFLDIPAIHLFTSLFSYQNPSIPPIISDQYPSSALRCLIAWKLMFVKFFFVKKLKNMFTGEFRSPLKMHHLVKTYLSVAKKSGYQCKKDRTYRLNEIGFNLVLPDLMLCPKAFQFSGNIPENRMYIGDFVDFKREETTIDVCLDGRPVIYCSLGTAASTYPQANNFYQAVNEASSIRNDWSFILQISDKNKIQNYKSTQNLFVVDWVPQIMLLQNTSVAVTHGGLNTIMECVGLEVPMVIVPGLRDQPGNAARAAYRDIALTADMKTIHATKLVSLIEQAMGSERVKAGLKKMKAAIKEEDGLNRSVRFIESYARTFSGVPFQK